MHTPYRSAGMLYHSNPLLLAIQIAIHGNNSLFAVRATLGLILVLFPAFLLSAVVKL